MGFFKKKEDISSLLSELNQIKGNDFNKLFKVYYQLGTLYFQKENIEKAFFYLTRADSLTMSIEDLNASEKDMDHCSEMILEIEDRTFLNQVLEDVIKKASKLSHDQQSLWGLLTLCRLKIILDCFSFNEGCEILKNVSNSIDSLYQVIVGEKEYETLNDNFLSDLYDFTDSEVYYNTNTTISFPCIKESIQLFDFEENSILTSFDCFMSAVDAPTSNDFYYDLIIGALSVLVSYYVRTQDQDIQTISQIQHEIKRIDHDFDMIINLPDEEEYIEKMNEYKEMNIFE